VPRGTIPGLSERLRGLLKGSQAAFARTHGFTENQVSRWMRGSLPEKAEDREKLAAALGVSVEYLLAGPGANLTAPPPDTIAIPHSSDADLNRQIRDHLVRQVELIKRLTERVEALEHGPPGIAGTDRAKPPRPVAQDKRLSTEAERKARRRTG
jgi:transcriptional regulator with XRE-family HTH domain